MRPADRKGEPKETTKVIEKTAIINFKSGKHGFYRSNGIQIECERQFCMKYLSTKGTEIHWDFIRAVFGSVANLALVPMQDVLGLGTEARMNLPNSTTGNWLWRFNESALTNDLAKRLRELSDLYGRVAEGAESEKCD